MLFSNYGVVLALFLSLNYFIFRVSISGDSKRFKEPTTGITRRHWTDKLSIKYANIFNKCKPYHIFCYLDKIHIYKIRYQIQVEVKYQMQCQVKYQMQC